MSGFDDPKALAKEVLEELKDSKEVKEGLAVGVDFASKEIAKLLGFGEIEFESWDELDNAKIALDAENIGVDILKKFGMLIVSRVLAHYGLGPVGEAFNAALKTMGEKSSAREDAAEAKREGILKANEERNTIKDIPDEDDDDTSLDNEPPVDIPTSTEDD